MDQGFAQLMEMLHKTNTQSRHHSQACVLYSFGETFPCHGIGFVRDGLRYRRCNSLWQRLQSVMRFSSESSPSELRD